MANPAIGRRGFLRAASMLALAGLSSYQTLAAAQEVQEKPVIDGANDWRLQLLGGHRDLWIRRTDSGEEGRFVYMEGGEWNREGYLAACRIFRDLHEDVTVAIDIALLDILCGNQRWLAHYGHTTPMILFSGHRTRRTNSRTEGASKDSSHIHGCGADIRFLNVPAATTGLMAVKFGCGGVGFYPGRHFTHVDSLRVRTWIGKRRSLA